MKSIPPLPPKPPLCQVVREGTVGTCPECLSTELRKYEFWMFSFGEKIGCLNPDCDNFYLNKNRIRLKKLKNIL